MGAGMPANEASRINQYNMFLMRDFERLWSFKTYRTPLTLRAMTRVTVQLLPWVYGPYWVYIANGRVGQQFAYAFACVISLLLIALLNLEDQMENPFRHGYIDAIRVKDEFELCRVGLATCTGYKDLSERAEEWHNTVEFEWEMVSNSASDDDDSVGY